MTRYIYLGESLLAGRAGHRYRSQCGDQGQSQRPAVAELMERFVLRGDIHRFRLPKGVSREQAGDRYGVVVHADEFLPRSVVIVAPTSRSARAAPSRPEAEIAGENTRFLVE